MTVSEEALPVRGGFDTQFWNHNCRLQGLQTYPLGFLRIMSVSHTFGLLALQATRNVADLAAAMGKLRSFVHLSTAYVNCDRPHGSHVEEALYPFDLSACHLQGVAPLVRDCSYK